ncbi:hypothetical protein A2907_01765 [Candidatus Azambacteria bacterium RIFCSPLOWO2_01_FULL_37_9]|uniref:50S ribosomal protein L28 n=1 Tax=Candidatus Azambacteria bacterium RIFCSPLOWO2_01_FULL_37_9 TaxID=1797297 RepID=A0A1F5C8N0_9BACT|nr:MAG: hypothetical protein A2907_01765 [Candidatus Azambacteria bacterium RIFCSPLOWO2_01_FULL_37_9]
MARQCAICEKTSQKATVFSNRVRATKFNPTTTKRQKANLQSVKLQNGKKVMACVKCIRTLHKI